MSLGAGWSQAALSAHIQFMRTLASWWAAPMAPPAGSRLMRARPISGRASGNGGGERLAGGGRPEDVVETWTPTPAGSLTVTLFPHL